MNRKYQNIFNGRRIRLREDEMPADNGLGAGMSNDVEMADDMEVSDNGQDGMQDDMQAGGQDDFEMTQENPDEAMGDEQAEQSGPVPYSKNGDVDQIVTGIREQCLQGLQMLANDIQDPAYELLKKMWDMCDKAQTPDDNAQQQGQRR